MRTVRLIAALVLLSALRLAAQGVLSPSLLRQSGATDGQVLCWSDANSRWQPCADQTGGTPAFSGITSGTNSSAAMIVGTGASLTTSGSGTITATSAATATTASTATALAANGANCSAGQAAAGVDASGAAEGCAALSADDLTDNTLSDLSDVSAKSGNTTVVATTSGVLTSGDCVEFDASGNLVAAGAACGVGGGATALNDLTDVTITSASTGEVLRYSGTAWVDATLAFSDLSGAATDAQVPNNITIDLAATATALAADPTDCSAGEFATTIAANGNLTCAAITDAEVPDTITASNYLPLAGGTMTGALVADEQGVEFLESDDVVTCAAGDYWIRADLSEAVLKKCENGSETVMDTTGGTPSFGTLTGGTNTGAAMIVGTGASLSVSGSGTIAATTSAALAANPTDCSANQFATTIAANGDLTCASISDADVPDTITASNYLPLAGGTMTGQIVADNLGIEFEDSDTNPTCGAGNYSIYADLSETTLKKCVNGVASDLDTGGAEVNALEADGASGIANTEIFIGTGAGTGNYAAVSGDATLANNGALTIANDAVTLAKLNDGANTPTLNDFVVVDTGATGVKYVAANAGTDITADLEEETHASEHSLGGGDAITATNLASACTDAQVLGGTAGGTGVECQTDDDVPEAGDFGAATDLDANGALNADSVAAAEIATDAVGLAEIDDDANTPTAGDFVTVETGAASVRYTTPNAGTDVTADLEEETHASEHAENAADELLGENLGTACSDGQVLKADATGGLTCGTDNTGGGGTDGSPNYTETFSGVTSVSMTNAEHGFGHANLIVECYDNASPKAKLEPASVTVNTSTYEVVASFSPAASGSCTVNGSGNASQRQWTKTTITPTELNDADTSEDETLFSATQYEKICGVAIKHSTAFSGGSVSALTVSVGTSANATIYASSFDIFQTAGDTVFQDSLVWRSATMAAAGHTVIARFDSTGDNLSALTAGSVDIWVCHEEIQ